MKKPLPFVISILFLLVSINAYSCLEPVSVCFDDPKNHFALIHQTKPVDVIIDENADPAIQDAAINFVNDLEKVSGQKAKLNHQVHSQHSAVIIGEIGQSKIIDSLIAAKKIEVSNISGQWEAFQISVVEDPLPNLKRALVIAGADRRGAVFGTYDLSQKIGVSPWYWFADIPVNQKENVYISAGSISDMPKVRYRGIFINDEDPALSSWAKKHFKGVNSEMYKHVFELILRLKGNYIWPAMWGKAIHFDDPKSTSLADNMGVVLGTSHHEPMTRAHAKWHRYPNDPTTGGAWDYTSNAKNLRKFWRGGIERMMSKGDGAPYESLVTVGMRGDGDEPMSEQTATELLEKVVEDQRQIIADVTGKPADKTPQVWALYKEVQSYYDQGMQVPDDVTLLFADDNWGQIRRLPTKDLDRKGGFGVYYHFDYVGAPRNYKWLNTTQISKVWQQMDLAYQRGAKDIWIVNVGDIKPMEFPIHFFMDMAWDPEKMGPKQAAQFPLKWASGTFGDKLSNQIAYLITEYSRYASRRKPELINPSTFKIGNPKDEILHSGEFGELVHKWRGLVDALQQVKQQIPASQYDAFYQLVEFPILALSNLYEMYYAAAWNKALAKQQDPRANYFLKVVEDTFKYDAVLTEKYHSINNGKWYGMMSQVHMNYVIWNDPKEQVMPQVTAVKSSDPIPEVKFSANNQVEPAILAIDASDYSRVVATKRLTWVAVPDLGQVDSAMISYPQGKSSSTINNGPRLEYDFTTKAEHDLTVTLVLGPTLDTIGKGDLEIAVSIDQQPAKIMKIRLQPTGGGPNTKDKRAWYDAVINHKVTLKEVFKSIPSGEHTLKVHRMDDNIILERITIK